LDILNSGVIPKPGAVQPGEGSRAKPFPAMSARDPSLRLKNGSAQDDARLAWTICSVETWHPETLKRETLKP
jgi:hypothetical protein